MAEFPSKVSTRTSSPAPGAGASASVLRPDLGFVRSSFGVLMLLQLALGLLVWALIADTPYHLYPAYGWVMFVAVFLWLVTIVFFTIYLFQLHMKLYMVPWPLVFMIFNVTATVLYITAFITCSAAVDQTSLKGSRPYNQRSAASFFACLVMITYGVSAFFSFQAWRGEGSNAATSQMAGGYA
ncbi:Plasmolipin [Heterocephalus glaber]|uniref:Plasmolipin n=1 Tax=Heterocephalus glaber TaxID=10181 RepID=G5AUE1_HETGA|nr:plasmolipin isoform X1 [Heterocephalus glaber]EHB00652.1 Plasmolipin [Heterocephalus glaber]